MSDYQDDLEPYHESLQKRALENFGKVKAEPLSKFLEEERNLRQKIEDFYQTAQTLNERNLVNIYLSDT